MVSIAMLRALTLAIALLAASCAKPNRPTWIIESAESGIIKVRLGEKTYTGICEHRVVLDTLTVREGPSACEIAPTITGKTIPAESRERDSNGRVVITELTIVKETKQHYRIVLRRFTEENASGGVYESFRAVWDEYQPENQPFIRPDYIWEEG